MSVACIINKNYRFSKHYILEICSASRICSFCLLFWCSNIVVLSVRIFRNCVVGHECFFKCWAIELYIYIYIYIVTHRQVWVFLVVFFIFQLIYVHNKILFLSIRMSLFRFFFDVVMLREFHEALPQQGLRCKENCIFFCIDVSFLYAPIDCM